MKIVIVGSGIAALSACDAILSTGAAATITVISCDTTTPYSKVALPKYVSGQIERAKVFLPAVMTRPAGAWLPEPVWLWDTTVVSIDRATRAVATTGPRGRAELPYDRLILAQGATPSCRFGRPFWTLDDADQVKALAAAGATASIAGGGFVGLHLAMALVHCGMKVTVFEREEHVMPGRTPPGFAGYLEETLRRSGVAVRTRAHMESAVCARNGWEVGVEVPGRGQEPLKFDFALDCTGTLPNTTLAGNAELHVCAGGILVDSSQRTSDLHILAAGDCAAVAHTSGEARSAGLWHQASDQGRVAGLAAVGVQAESLPSTGWHTFEIPVPSDAGGERAGSGPAHITPRVACSFGDLVPLATDKVLESGDPARDDYRYAIVSGGRVSGYFTTASPAEMGGLIARLGRLEAGSGELSAARYPSPFSVVAELQPLPIGPGHGKVLVKGRRE